MVMKSRSGKTTTLLGNAGGAADAPTAPRAAVAASATPTSATTSRRRDVGVSVRDGPDRKSERMRLLVCFVVRRGGALRRSSRAHSHDSSEPPRVNPAPLAETFKHPRQDVGPKTIVDAAPASDRPLRARPRA